MPQLLRIARKARRIGLVTGWDLAGIALKMPLIVGQVIGAHRERKRRRRQRARLDKPTNDLPTARSTAPAANKI